MIRAALFSGIAWSFACAPTPASLGLLPPESTSEPTPAPTIVEVETRWEAVDDWRPAPAPVVVSTPGDAVRDVVYTDPGELPRMLAAGVALPLRNTEVRAHLRGNTAEVMVRQRFVNDHDTALEASYVFPLPENSAVADMRIVIGKRVIASEVRERGEARKVYEDARESGHTTALLEQERPNIFTQSIANIAPGEAIDVEIRYLQTLSYDSGEYEFVFPTVVGPRYAPGDRVPDAARINPPVLGRGQRSGNDLAIEVIAEAGSPISAWSVQAHAVEGKTVGDRLEVKLARRDELANRDFVLRYRSAAAQPVARLFLGPGGKHGGHFMLVAEPPRVDVDALVGRRELIFVVDVSGSMNGAPLALAKAAVREALAGTRPVDTFDVVVFAGRTARLFEAPRPASAENLRRALEFIDGLSAGGGTEMADAVHSSLHGPVADGRHRYVFFLTDGYIGEETQIASGARALIAAQRKLGRRARVFGVGIGASPNDSLISGLSRAGDGLPLYVRQWSDVARAVNSFQRLIDAPIVSDVSVDWGGVKVSGVYPNAAPDLFASHPLVLHGRFVGPPPKQLALRGTVDGRAVSFPIDITPAGERDDVLATLWARAKVETLEQRLASDPTIDRDATRAEILAVGLRHHIVTGYTSLVAVDSARRVVGPLLSVVQPVEVVDGMHVTHTRMSYSNIPVGGASRDFTSVIDLSPTVRNDAAGVRLTATSAAAPRITVQPAAPRSRTPVPEDIRQLERGARASVPGPALGSGVEAHARLRLREIAGADAAQRRALTGDLEGLGQCFVTAPRASYRVLRRVGLTLLFGRDGRLTDLRIAGAGTDDPELHGCLRARLDDLALHAAPGARIELQLAVTMQF